MKWNQEIRKSIARVILGCVGACFMAGSISVQAAEDTEISGTIEVSSNVGEDYMEQYIEGFEKKYPNVKVEYHYYEDYEDAIQQRLPYGNYGDVLFVPSFVRADEYAQYFTPLGEYTELAQKYNYLEASKYTEGTVYGLPYSAYLAGILYNKDVFYQAGITDTPKSVDEFLTDLEYIKERTNAIPFYTNYAANWTLTFWEQFPYIEMTGNPEYKEIGIVNEKDPFLKGTTHYTVYKMLYDIVKDNLSERNPLMSDWNSSKSMLNAGKIGCMAIGSWAINQVKEAGPNPDSVAFMPFPNEINGRQYMTISTDYCYAINRNTKNEAAAKAYIEYMLDESGYALDHGTLSLVKTDPYPDAYGNMENVILLSNAPATDESYQKKQMLTSRLNLETDTSEVKRVIEAAIGQRKESFDDIAEDWNNRWESSRTVDIPVEESSGNAIQESAITGEYEVNFSQTEKEYLDGLGTVRVGYLRNGAPFQYENGTEFTGLASAILADIKENCGLEVAYYGYDNTQQLQEALTTGIIDIAAGMVMESGSENHVKYSKPYMDSLKVAVKNDVVDVNQMTQYGRLALIRGEKNPYFQNAENNGNEYESLAEAIVAVEKLEADYVITDYYSADYYIREQECNRVTIVPLSGMSQYCLTFPEDVDTRLVSVCNKCIYSIADEKMQIMLREYTQPPAKPVTLRRFVEANPFMSIIVVCIVFIIFIAGILIIMMEKNRSARKHELDMKRYEILASMVDEYIFEYEYTTDCVRFDEKFAQKFGLMKQFALSATKYDSQDMKTIVEQCRRVVMEGQGAQTEFQLTDADGYTQWYRLIGHSVTDSNGKVMHVIGKLVNIQKEMEEKLEIADKAQRDPLTGLYNRDGFSQNYESLCMTLNENDSLLFAVMDLDNFKNVNDTLGHVGGDEALLRLAYNLKKTFAENAVIARYGGDEFMLCASGMDEETARVRLAQLVESMDCQFTYQGLTQKLSISLGAVYTSQKLSMNILFKEADKVLYKTKEAGKDSYRLIRHLDEI